MSPKSPSKTTPAKKGRKGSSSVPSPELSEAEKLIAAAAKEALTVESLVIKIPADGHLGVTICNHPLGVMLSAVDPIDLAHGAGLRAGDVILSVNDTRVGDHAEAAHLMFDEGHGKWEDLALTYYSARTCERFLVRCRRRVVSSQISKARALPTRLLPTRLLLLPNRWLLLCVSAPMTIL